jgi:hypothetical protein
MRDNHAGAPAHVTAYDTYASVLASRGQGAATDGEEDFCPAFGFLRGLDARAQAVEFRLLGGNSEWFAYNCLVSWRLNPSVGLLLKFTSGDGVSLVLIHGSNLDVPVGQAQVNLTDRGLQRHRILYVREMSEAELRQAGRGAPSIDRIDIGEFETVEEQNEWLKTRAPAFVRKQE